MVQGKPVPTVLLGDFLLPQPAIVRQDDVGVEDQDVGVEDQETTANECNSGENISDIIEVGSISWLQAELSDNTAFYEEDQTENRHAGRGRRHHKRHRQNNGQRDRQYQRSRD